MTEATELRSRLRNVDASLTVVKNTLAKRAAVEAGVEGLDVLLEGPTAIAFCRGDLVAPAKVLQGFIREKKKLVIKGGYLQSRVLQAAQVEQLATLPSREELIAKVVGGIAAPLYWSGQRAYRAHPWVCGHARSDQGAKSQSRIACLSS